MMSMKSWRGFVGFVLFALVAWSGGVAASTITGATGLIQVPTAGVLSVGEAEGSVRYVDGQVGLSASYGVFESVEIAVNTLKPGDSPANLGIVFKGLLFGETADRPGVAVGFETDQSYIVASKRLTPRIRMHVGFGDGDLRGALGGVSYALNTATVSGAAPTTTIMAEYVQGRINVGARMVFSPMISVDLGLLDLNRISAGASVRAAF